MPVNRTPSIDILPIGPDDLSAQTDGMIAVYRAAFAQPPYHRGDDEVRDFAECFVRHATFDGFQSVVARFDPGSDIAGFAYGYTLAPGQWWYEQIAPLLRDDQVAAPLPGAFLLTQLAVRPEFQGRGIGRRLHDALLTLIAHDHALLSTRQGDSTARHLYAWRGWCTLLSGVAFPGAGHPYMMLVLERPRSATGMSRSSA